jgi:hypothetical protein
LNVIYNSKFCLLWRIGRSFVVGDFVKKKCILHRSLIMLNFYLFIFK